jgi:Spy/CpxP family protein refolding chaperone
MRLTVATGFALSASLVWSACAAHAPETAAPTSASQPADDQAASELREHHRHHHQGGVTQFIAMSLDTLGADEAKRPQIEKLQGDLHVCMKPAREFEKSILATLSDGVAAGTIDTAKVDAAITQLNTAATGVNECSVAAFHAILSPAERAALVDKVQAHWGVWRQVNHEAPGGGSEQGGRLADLAQELNLSPDQVGKMSTALQTAMTGAAGSFDPQSAQAHVQAFTAAFVAESFDAKSIAANANGHLATHGAKRMALFYETVTPLLTPEQRATLAAHLREHSTHQPAVSAK